jgi:hypothetical protein
MKILSFFQFFWVVLPSWIRIRIRNLYADPDPAAQINADPCGSGYGSGSETLLPSDYQPTSQSLRVEEVEGSGLVTHSLGLTLVTI